VVNPRLESLFPRLAQTTFALESPATDLYNCIAWAAEQNNVWWWPDPLNVSFWPLGIPRVETLEAFEQAYSLLGYQRCADPTLESGFQKIAIFADQQRKPTHAARQLPDGDWTSKIGELEDISHRRLEALGGTDYGEPALFMRRSNPAFSGSGQWGCLLGPFVSFRTRH
jgi:hypothetical protein